MNWKNLYCLTQLDSFHGMPEAQPPSFLGDILNDTLFLFPVPSSRLPVPGPAAGTLYPRGTSTPAPHSRYHIPIGKFYKKMNSKVREIYTEIWKLHKAYYDTQSDAEWERLIGETEKLLQRYGRNKFAVKLAEAMISEIESRQK